MNGIDSEALGCVEDGIRAEITLGGGGGAETDALSRHVHMAGLTVGLGVNCHCGNAHAIKRANDAAGDLTPVRNQNLFHGRASQMLTRIGVGL
jgi:hypothetical protein